MCRIVKNVHAYVFLIIAVDLQALVAWRKELASKTSPPASFGNLLSATETAARARTKAKHNSRDLNQNNKAWRKFFVNNELYFVFKLLYFKENLFEVCIANL